MDVSYYQLPLIKRKKNVNMEYKIKWNEFHNNKKSLHHASRTYSSTFVIYKLNK